MNTPPVVLKREFRSEVIGGARVAAHGGGSAFTLVEMLVAMAVLALLLVLILQLFNSTATITSMGNKHMDADAQARALLDRMAIDFGAMVKRSDVDYYLKGRPSTNDQKNSSDQIAFYSEVSGFYPASSNNSPVSLISYRLNSTTQRVERLGKGLQWNASAAANIPVVFLPIPIASPLPSPLPSPMPASAPTPAWPQAASMTTVDPDYEAIGPQIFRFEYYYVLKGQDVSTNPSILSDTPWDTRSPLNHNSVNGMQDLSAIGVVIAVLDSKSRVLVSDTALATLATQMNDFDKTMKPGDLEAQWQTTVNASGLPASASSAIRIYGRYFYLNSPNP